MNNHNKTPIWDSVVSASVKGVAHARDGTVCQDAVSVKEGMYRGQPYLICCVADGHGSPAYTHSDKGSALAALAAEQTAIQFILSAKADRENRVRHFGQYFKTHLKEEWLRNIAQSQSTYRPVPELVRKHGTTLLCALVFRGKVFMAQLGDGDICLIDQTGEASFLVEPETGPVSSTTWSLCSDALDDQWRFACRNTADISFLMMSSDGLINSLASNDEYTKLATTLENYLRRFPSSEIKKVLPEWLADYSKRGSGDDVSLVAIAMGSNPKNKTGEENETDTENTGP